MTAPARSVSGPIQCSHATAINVGTGGVKGFLAVSNAPDSPPALEYGQHARAVRYLADSAMATVHRSPDGWVAFTGPDPDDAAADPAQGFTVRLSRSTRSRTGDVPVAGLAAMLGDGARVDAPGLAGLLPPAAAAHRPGPYSATVLAADWCGMRQLHLWQGDGAAAVSTSALALAALAGAGLSTPVLQIQGLIGWQIGTRTLFEGVTKLPPGSYAVLRDGRVEVHRYDEGFLDEQPAMPLRAVVDEMAEILRKLLGGYVTDHPASVLQLTAGQDSRVLLAAIPPKLRGGLPALTLDTHGGPEHAIAGRLAALCGLNHHMHWLDEQPAVEPAAAYRMVVDASIALDGMASPLALAPLSLAEAVLQQCHPLPGAGGEVARGFYYPGQPRHATTSPRLVTP